MLLDVIAVDVQGDDPCTSLAKTYTPDYDDTPNSSWPNVALLNQCDHYLQRFRSWPNVPLLN